MGGRRTTEFLELMKDIEHRYEGQELLVILDNLFTHFTVEIEDWLAKNPE